MYGFCSRNAHYLKSLSFRMFIWTFWLFKLCHVSLFLCLYNISWGWYCWKSLAKSGGFRKKWKTGGWPYRGGSLWKFTLSAHYGLTVFFFHFVHLFSDEFNDFACNIWLQIVSLLALHPPNWHLHPQRTLGVFCCQLSGL